MTIRNPVVPGEPDREVMLVSDTVLKTNIVLVMALNALVHGMMIGLNGLDGLLKRVVIPIKHVTLIL